MLFEELIGGKIQELIGFLLIIFAVNVVVAPYFYQRRKRKERDNPNAWKNHGSNGGGDFGSGGDPGQF